jgi:hypothetical protein
MANDPHASPAPDRAAEPAQSDRATQRGWTPWYGQGGAGRTAIRRRRLSAGQAMVEFAFVAPIFFLIFFGILEYSLIMASVGGFDFAAREAARLGSVLGRTDPNVDTKVVATVNINVQGIVMARAQELDIYRAARDGQCLDAAAPATGNEVAPGSALCIEDIYQFSSGTWTTQTWPPDARDDSLLGADYLGIRLTYSYTYLTGFIAAAGSTLNLTASTVQRIEPQEYGVFLHGGGPPSAGSQTDLAPAWRRPGAEGGLA